MYAGYDLIEARGDVQRERERDRERGRERERERRGGEESEIKMR